MEKSLQQTADALKARVNTGARPLRKFEVAEPAGWLAAVAGGQRPAGAVVAPLQVVPVRRKRVLHISQSGEGYRVWLLGKTQFYKFE